MSEVNMSANLIKAIWRAVETTQSATLLRLDDGELLSTLIKRLKNSNSITSAEVKDASSYINSRLSLIRDLAQSRLEEDLGCSLVAAFN
jgi:hypothetical protein